MIYNCGLITEVLLSFFHIVVHCTEQDVSQQCSINSYQNLFIFVKIHCRAFVHILCRRFTTAVENFKIQIPKIQGYFNKVSSCAVKELNNNKFIYFLQPREYAFEESGREQEFEPSHTAPEDSSVPDQEPVITETAQFRGEYSYSPESMFSGKQVLL